MQNVKLTYLDIELKHTISGDSQSYLININPVLIQNFGKISLRKTRKIMLCKVRLNIEKLKKHKKKLVFKIYEFFLDCPVFQCSGQSHLAWVESHLM